MNRYNYRNRRMSKLNESTDIYDIWQVLQDKYHYVEGDIIASEDLYNCLGDYPWDPVDDTDFFENEFGVTIDYDDEDEYEDSEEKHINDILYHYGPEALKDYGYEDYYEEDDLNESSRYSRMRRINEAEEVTDDQYKEIQFLISNSIQSFEDAEYLKKFIIDLRYKNNSFKTWLQSYKADEQNNSPLSE